MRSIFFVLLAVSLSGCASGSDGARKVASVAEESGNFHIMRTPISYSIVDRGWQTYSNSVELTDQSSLPFTSFDSVGSFLIRHEVQSADQLNAVKRSSIAKAEDQCIAIKDREKKNPRHHAEGFTSHFSARIVNTYYMPGGTEVRYVCLVSIVAVKE